MELFMKNKDRMDVYHHKRQSSRRYKTRRYLARKAKCGRLALTDSAFTLPGVASEHAYAINEAK